MIIKRFELNDIIGKAKNAAEVYEAIGYPLESFADYKVFGKRAYHRNLFMTDKTFNDIKDILVKNIHAEGDSKTHARMKVIFDWSNFSPMSSGPRYKEFQERIGHVLNNCLYIIQPDDDMYEEAPDV